MLKNRSRNASCCWPNALAATDKRTAALHTFNQALTLGGDQTPIHRALARLYTEQGALDDALQAWETTATLDANDREARLALATLHLQHGTPRRFSLRWRLFWPTMPTTPKYGLRSPNRHWRPVTSAKHATPQPSRLHHQPQSPACVHSSPAPNMPPAMLRALFKPCGRSLSMGRLT